MKQTMVPLAVAAALLMTPAACGPDGGPSSPASAGVAAPPDPPASAGVAAPPERRAWHQFGFQDPILDQVVLHYLGQACSFPT